MSDRDWHSSRVSRPERLRSLLVENTAQLKLAVGSSIAQDRAMKPILRAVALWLTLVWMAWMFVPAAGRMLAPLVGTVTAALFPSQSPPVFGAVQFGGAWLLLPVIAVGLAWAVLQVLPAQRWVRIPFWVVTSAGWLAALLLAQGRGEISPAGEQWMIGLGLGLALLFACWLGWKARAALTKRALGEVAAGLFVLAAMLVIGVWCFAARTRAIAAEARASWAAIGFPMSECDKAHPVGGESAGSAATRQALLDVVGANFYKVPEPSPPADANRRAKAGTDGGNVVVAAGTMPLSDDATFPPEAAAVLAPYVPVLDAAYASILAVDPPGWNSDPADGFAIAVPNFLGVRIFCQLSSADALRRLSGGDAAGASRAIAANQRIRDGLRKSPPLVSLMISVALDGLLAKTKARLPADDTDSFDAIARDTADLRGRLLTTIQLESWIFLRTMDSPAFETGLGMDFLPGWARRPTELAVARQMLAASARQGARHMAIVKSDVTLRQSDFGSSLHDAVATTSPSGGWWAFDPTRAHMRIYATLLLREQAELIREVRARLAAGRPLESRDSVVLPGVRWEVTVGAEKNVVAMRLVGAPAWIEKGTVTPPEFWLFPLDGSVPWKFHPPAGEGE